MPTIDSMKQYAKDMAQWRNEQGVVLLASFLLPRNYVGLIFLYGNGTYWETLYEMKDGEYLLLGNGTSPTQAEAESSLFRVFDYWQAYGQTAIEDNSAIKVEVGNAIRPIGFRPPIPPD